MDEFVNEMESVELLPVDEVSACGAAALEVINRRMQQVARVLWRKRFRSPPPDDMGPFGGIGVLLMGDFAQLPPVLSSSLLAEAPLHDGKSAGLRSLALAGLRTSHTFQQIVRLRRVHRLPGADRYNEPAFGLRDVAIAAEDLQLWKRMSYTAWTPT